MQCRESIDSDNVVGPRADVADADNGRKVVDLVVAAPEHAPGLLVGEITALDHDTRSCVQLLELRVQATAREVVDDRDLVGSVLDKLLHKVKADESCAPRNQDFPAAHAGV